MADSPFTERQVALGDVSLHVVEAGAGRPVVLCHGFPELAHSWRCQLPALMDAGYHALAPDMRGFGQSSIPPAVEDYAVDRVSGDLIGLLDELGEERALFVGHDWGAVVVWHLARAHPERVAALACMSVPFIPPAPMPPLAALRQALGENFYIVWFQRPGVADAALAADVRRTLMTRRLWSPAWARADEEVERPAWWSEDDERFYVKSFTRTGFTGGLNYYRNLDRNWELARALGERRVEQPALFLAGERDQVLQWAPPQTMDGWVSDLRDTVILSGAAHWVQQERPQDVNDALVRFIAECGY